MKELARFLFQRGDYSPGNRVVRPKAFLPHNGQTSVFAIAGLGQLAINALGEELGRTRGKPAKGRAELDVVDVTAVGLRFVRDDVPPRHGNLVGWPNEGPEL